MLRNINVRYYYYYRYLQVLFSGGVSSWVDIIYGVPQGSVLGPLLQFNLFMNDLSRSISCSCVLFADDIFLYPYINNPSGEHTLQLDLNRLKN